jgi:MYXO-CTERM domain-containing protein
MALATVLIAAFVAFPAPVPIGDEDAPSVTIDAPVDGDSFVDVPTSIAIQITADDGMGLGVRDVRLQIGGELLPNEDTQAPYELDVELPRGTWILMAVARDWAGNIGRSTPVVVQVGPIEADTSGGEIEDDGSTSGTTEPMATDTSEGTDATNESSGGDSEIADGGVPRGCACAAEPSSPPWMLAILGLLGLRRRQR